MEKLRTIVWAHYNPWHKERPTWRFETSLNSFCSSRRSTVTRLRQRQPRQSSETLGMRDIARKKSPKTKPATSERNLDEVMVSRLAAIVESSDDAIIGKTIEGVI